MPFDFFGKKKRREPRPPESESSAERTAEEEALAERAAAEAARRAQERRGQAADAGGLLGDMLDVSGASEEAEPPARERGPSLDMVLEAEPAEGPGEAPTPFAPFPEEAEPPPPEAAAEEPSGEPGPRRLSPPLREAFARIGAMGRSAGDRRPSFQPEEAAGDADRTMAMLAASIHRPRALLEFESESSAELPADAADRFAQAAAVLEQVRRPDAVSAQAEAPPPPGAAERPGELSGDYTLEDLPGEPGERPGVGGDLSEEAAPGGEVLREGDLPGAELLAAPRPSPPEKEPPPSPAAGEPAAPEADYGLEDLPSAPEGSPEPRREDEGAPSGPRMEEADLDEAGLDEALAAADDMEAAPGAEGRASDDYSLGDLPEPPSGEPGAEPGDEREGPDERMSAQALPDLSPPPREPGEPGQEAPSGEEAPAMSETELPPPPPPPSGELVRAGRAGDLTAGQLAAVERLIESEVEGEDLARPPSERREPPARKLSLAARKLRRLALMLAAGARATVELLDRLLAPYSLSCKVLLGIIGVITLAVVGALSFKTWVLPWLRSPGG